MFQLFVWTRLSGGGLEWPHRRILLLVAISWLPLLLLSVLSGRATGALNIQFLHDIETHVRFLVALPALIAGELVISSRIHSEVR